MDEIIRRNPWQTSLWDCCNDPSLALNVVICPCFQVGENNYMLGSCDLGIGSSLIYMMGCLCFNMGCLFHTGIRREVRERYQLVEAPCNDRCVTFLCPCCAICQETRELRYHRAIKDAQMLAAETRRRQQGPRQEGFQEEAQHEHFDAMPINASM